METNLAEFLASLLVGSSFMGVYGQIVGLLVTVGVPLASAIVNYTDTPNDDEIYGKYVYPFIEFLALVRNKAKQKAGDK